MLVRKILNIITLNCTQFLSQSASTICVSKLEISRRGHERHS